MYGCGEIAAGFGVQVHHTGTAHAGNVCVLPVFFVADVVDVCADFEVFKRLVPRADIPYAITRRLENSVAADAAVFFRPAQFGIDAPFSLRVVHAQNAVERVGGIQRRAVLLLAAHPRDAAGDLPARQEFVGGGGFGTVGFDPIQILILVLDNRASANGGGTDFSAVDEVAVTVVERGDLRTGAFVFELHPQFKAVGAFGFEVGIGNDGIAVGRISKRHGRAVKRRRAEALGISGKSGELLTHRHAQAQAGRKRGITEARRRSSGIGVEIGLVGRRVQLVFFVT